MARSQQRLLVLAGIAALTLFFTLNWGGRGEGNKFGLNWSSSNSNTNGRGKAPPLSQITPIKAGHTVIYERAIHDGE